MKKLITFAGLTLLAATTAAQEEVPDVRKFRVEEPIKDALTLVAGTHTSEIAWHADLDAAKAAAARSGKPILLFQLLGKLDEEFC